MNGGLFIDFNGSWSRLQVQESENDIGPVLLPLLIMQDNVKLGREEPLGNEEKGDFQD